MTFRSGRSLVASRRNLAMQDAAYCNYCGLLIPDVFQDEHLIKVHGIIRKIECAGSSTVNKITYALKSDKHDHICCEHAHTKNIIVNGKEIELRE